MKNRTLLSAAVLISAVSTNASALDLLEAYSQAQLYDAQYMTSLSAYQSAILDLPLAKTANRPSLAAVLGLQHNDDTLDPDDGPSRSANYEQGRAALDLEQNLYDRSINYDIESAGYSVDISELQLGIAKEDLIVRTVQAYFNVLSALDNLNLADLERESINQQLDLATQRLEVGLGTRTDQYDAQARYEAANAEYIASQNEVINAQQALEALMGQRIEADPKDTVRPLDIEKVSHKLVEGEQWVEDVLGRNRAYQIKLRQIDLSQVEVARSQDARWPSFEAYAGAQANDSGASNFTSGAATQEWQVGIRGSMPIYLGGSIKLKQEKSGHAFSAASFEAETSRRNTDRLIRAARRGVESLQRQLEARREGVIAGKSALESKEEGFKAGVTTNIDVLNAQRDLFFAGRNYLSTSYDLVNAIVVLERAAGQLNDQDVANINSWLK